MRERPGAESMTQRSGLGNGTIASREPYLG